MKVNVVSLKNFRSYESAEFEFSDGLNVIEGKNTVGKTNLVESVYFCSFGKSPRTSKDKDCIRWGAESAEIHLKASRKYRDRSIDMTLSQNGEKRFATDGAGISKLTELIGVINTVYFSPDELKMIKDGPQERRRFLDMSLSQQNKTYLYNLSKYSLILKHRNNLLKEKNSPEYIESTLPIWDHQLVEAGIDIIKSRLSFIDHLSPIVDDIHRSISSSDSGLDIEYETNIDLDNVRNDFARKLTENREKDVRLGYTTVGPHRDDIIIKTKGIDIRSFGSQGQQRTASLAIKIAETVCIEEYVGEKPILILDDVLSELDPTRRKALLERTKDIQVLLTCTDYTEDEAFVKNRIFLK